MKALIFEGPQRLRLGEWAEPVLGPGEVLLCPLATGICAGDLAIYAGRNPYAQYPLVAGHEICGDVLALGTGVTGLRPGDRAVIEPVVGCGQCYPCRHGKPNCCSRFCLIGLHRPGGYAERVVAPAAQVHPVPAGLDPVVASFAEPLAVALHACRRGAVATGETVVVLGAGPIGLALIEVARLRGARVLATDPRPDRLAAARQCGAEPLPVGERLVDMVHECTGGDGADVVLEATGAAGAIGGTLDLVASGGRIVIVGLVPRGTPVALPGLDLTRKEVNLLGSRNSVHCFPEAVALLARGAIGYPRFATPLPLWEGAEIFARLHAQPGTLHKAVLVSPPA